MRRGVVVAGVAASLAGYAVLLALLRPQTGQLAQLPYGDWWTWLQADPERGLLLGLSCVAWLVATWLFVVTGLSLVATSSGSGARLAKGVLRRITPFAIRRTLEAALATALAVGSAGIAVAGPVGATAAQPSPGATATTSLSPLPPVPDPIVAPAEAGIPDLDRPTVVLPLRAPPPVAASPPLAVPPATKTAPPAAAQSHLVVAGDTLWDVAAEALPTLTSPAEITRSWQEWYARNQSTIGANPALIHPGQLLVAPRATP
jgi:resuscitation-promoting factor RpfA